MSSGILRWAVEGCLEWRRVGLKDPDTVLNAVKEYRSEMDVLGQFLEECCDVGPKVKSDAGDLYGAYGQWCKEGGEFAMSNRVFGLELGRRGHNKVKSGGKNWRFGLALNATGKRCAAGYSWLSDLRAEGGG